MNTFTIFLSTFSPTSPLVEPVTKNHDDLTDFINKNSLNNRIKTIRGAVTSQCNSSTIKFAFPEGYQDSKQHWLRRQIGFLIDSNKDKNANSFLKDPKWNTLEVPCYSGASILRKRKLLFL